MGPEEHAARARRLYEVLLARRYERSSALFTAGRRRRYEHLWPFANAWAATCALAAMPGGGDGGADLAERRRGCARYGRTTAGPLLESSVVPPLGPGGDVYHDDNAWVALALLHQHRLTGDRSCVDDSARLLGAVATSWCGDRGWVHPGGLRWAQPAWSTSRNTCVNGPAAALAALLHRIDGSPATLTFARRVYGWTQRALGRPDGLYADRIGPDGAVEGTTWSYNQGAMIGAGVALFRVTGRSRYLAHARRTAEASLAALPAPALAAQGPAFAAIYLRNLFLLGEELPGPAARFRQRAEEVAVLLDRAPTGRRRRLGRPVPAVNTLAPLAAVHALLAGAPPHP